MIGLDNYFTETSCLLRSVSFDHAGGRYEGRGKLRWAPETGFHIEAYLARHGPPPLSKIEIGEVGILSRQDMQAIRMRLEGSNWAVVPRIPLPHRFDVIEQNHLSLTTDGVILGCRSITPTTDEVCGRALLVVDGPVPFGDVVKTETRINNDLLTMSMSRGMDAKDENVHVIGTPRSHSTVELSYWMDGVAINRRRGWDWPLAARDALSILTGQKVVLLVRNVQRGQQHITEAWKQEPVKKLGLLAPLGTQPSINHAGFLKLTDFLLGATQEASVCRAMFGQLVEASDQHSWQARELLVATILEAALRTVEGTPISHKGKPWNVAGALKRFQEKYLSKEWRPARKKALRCFEHLRHRNAHPDWLTTSGGTASAEALTEALDEIIFLTRFYGYMILAFAGFQGIRPSFPKPHREWGPMLTVSRGNSAQNAQTGVPSGAAEDQQQS